MIIIKRDGYTRAIKNVYEFRVDVSANSETIHVYLESYYQTQRGKIIENSPRWRRGDPRFSNLDFVKVPKSVTDEVLGRLRYNIVLHYPKKDVSDE